MDLAMSSTDCSKSNIVIWSLSTLCFFGPLCVVSLLSNNIPSKQHNFSRSRTAGGIILLCSSSFYFVFTIKFDSRSHDVLYTSMCTPTQITPVHCYMIRPIYTQSYVPRPQVDLNIHRTQIQKREVVQTLTDNNKNEMIYHLQQ